MKTIPMVTSLRWARGLLMKFTSIFVNHVQAPNLLDLRSSVTVLEVWFWEQLYHSLRSIKIRCMVIFLWAHLILGSCTNQASLSLVLSGSSKSGKRVSHLTNYQWVILPQSKRQLFSNSLLQKVWNGSNMSNSYLPIKIHMLSSTQQEFKFAERLLKIRKKEVIIFKWLITF